MPLMRVFTENDMCAVTSRLVFMGNWGRTDAFEPDYSILKDPEHHPTFMNALAAGKRFLINKDEFGHELCKRECDYDIFPDIASYKVVKPAFVLRDPIRIFDSWKRLGWLDAESLVSCCTKLGEMLDLASEDSFCLIYERLVQDPQREIKALCLWWDVPFWDHMLHFAKPFGTFLFNSDREQNIYCERNPEGLFTTVQSHSEIVPNIPSHRLLTRDEVEHVEDAVGKMYLRRWGARLREFRASLLSKAWFGFDLDDTLHEFRQASSVALSSVLSKVNEDHRISIDDMQKEYRLILAEKTATAFTDGRTSHEYRKERFQAVLDKFGILCTDHYLDALAQLYEAALARSLCLKCGAFSLLDNLQKLGKKIVIITEGPQDAQEWTLKILGISEKVDFLATTNHFRTSKIDGLLGKVLEHLHIAATDLVYIGDSWVRDMEPAIKESIYAVHYAEADNFSLDQYPIKINTLKKLNWIIEDVPAPL